MTVKMQTFKMSTDRWVVFTTNYQSVANRFNYNTIYMLSNYNLHLFQWFRHETEGRQLTKSR